MHRVPNFGSALQAYALQHKLFQHGIDNKIIDYIYSYAGYEPSWGRYIYDKVKYYAKVILRRPASMTRFFFFHKKYLKTTFREYTKNELMFGKAPSFDAYMTGSDQVWNCKFTKGDTNFLLKFAPSDASRLSYGSSFASSSIPKEYQQSFKEELEKYDTILVREKSGVDIVRDLTGKKAEVVCDPTLLLTDKEYHVLSTRGKLKLHEPYILVYVLDYMYNPYPDIYNIVRKVKEELGCKVIYIGTNAVDPTDDAASYVGGAYWTFGIPATYGTCLLCNNNFFSWHSLCDHIPQTLGLCWPGYGVRGWKNANFAQCLRTKRLVGIL